MEEKEGGKGRGGKDRGAGMEEETH